MTGGLLSGGVVLAIAALLWLIYLLPTWIRRSQYLATERNIVRLQQSMRILAETSEVPDEVRVEATAREVAEQQRVLRKVQANAKARARETALAAANVEPRSADPRVRIARSRRNARLTTTIVMLASVFGMLMGAWQVLTGGQGMLLLGSVAATALCGVMLMRMARVGAKPAVATSAPVERPSRQTFEPVTIEADVVETDVAQTWTPKPLPKPLYLSQGSAAAGAMAQADAHEQLRRAALAQVMAQRAAELEPRVPTIDTRRAANEAAAQASAIAEPEVAPVSRFAGMGVVDDAEVAITDVAALLRKRRAAS